MHKMIDYEKLNEALDLCSKLKISRLNLEFRNGNEEIYYELVWLADTKKTFYSYTIDGILHKLKELIQPKYKDGDEVWFLLGDQIHRDKFAKEFMHEEGLFPSKVDLIKHQATYWTKLWREYEPVECKHEWDGTMALSHPPKLKCIKCGKYLEQRDFYK